MRTFLAGFCTPGGPLAKAVGIFLEKQPLPGDHDPPLGISKSYLSKNLKLGDAKHFWRVFALLGRSSGKSRRDFPGKTAPPWGPRPPLGNFKRLSLLKIFSMGMRTFLA